MGVGSLGGAADLAGGDLPAQTPTATPPGGKEASDG
jgi:hypothetical protein